MAEAPTNSSPFSDGDGGQYIVVLVPASLRGGNLTGAVEVTARPPSPPPPAAAGGYGAAHRAEAPPLTDDAAPEAFVAVGGTSGLLARASARTRVAVRFGRDLLARAAAGMGAGGADLPAPATDEEAGRGSWLEGAATAVPNAAAIGTNVAGVAAAAIAAALAATSSPAGAMAAGSAAATQAHLPLGDPAGRPAPEEGPSPEPEAAPAVQSAVEADCGSVDVADAPGTGMAAGAMSEDAAADGTEAALGPGRAISTSPVTPAAVDLVVTPGIGVALTRRQESDLSRMNARRWAASQARTGSASHGSQGSPRRAGLATRSKSDGAALRTGGTGAPPGGGSRSDGRMAPQTHRLRGGGAGSFRAATTTATTTAPRAGGTGAAVPAPKPRVPRCRRRVSFQASSTGDAGSDERNARK